MSVPIYLDGFASLPIAPEAQAALIEALASPGNAGSPHRAGEEAAQRVATARNDVASLIGAAPGEIVFTSGATEANNLALLGVARRLREEGIRRSRIIVSAVEHKAVLEPAAALAREGFTVAIAPVDRAGTLDRDAFRDLVDDETLLVSIMTVNNETGIVQPIAEAAEYAHEAGALFHTDTAQGAGKIPIDVVELDVDYLSLSGHKLYGPMGIGALYVAASAPKPFPLLYGGGQQASVRPGTEPVPLIAALGAAAKTATEALERDMLHGNELAALLLAELAARQVSYSRITKNAKIVPGSLSIQIAGIDADLLCTRLADHVQLSTGSACTSGQLRTSHVLEAMGFPHHSARQVLRAFCHRYLCADDIRSAAAQIASAVHQTVVAAGGVVQ